jgi:hypothetical protein
LLKDGYAIPFPPLPPDHIFFTGYKAHILFTTGKSEAVNQRTDKTMTKIKRTKRQTMIYKTHHRKLKIE